MKYKQRDIVLVPFPYSDLSTLKKRPVLIVSNNEYNRNFQDIVVCVITSRRYKDNYSIWLENDDLEIGLLPESSVIKTHKLFTIQQSKIVKKFSTIKPALFVQVYDMIEHLIQVSP